MKSLRIRLVSAVLFAASLIYGADWSCLRYRNWKRGDAFGSVTVTQVYVIHEKNGKAEYQFAPPQNQVCVHSLFPHLGYDPCWYVSRHTEKRIEI